MQALGNIFIVLQRKSGAAGGGGGRGLPNKFVANKQFVYICNEVKKTDKLK